MSASVHVRNVRRVIRITERTVIACSSCRLDIWRGRVSDMPNDAPPSVDATAAALTAIDAAPNHPIVTNPPVVANPGAAASPPAAANDDASPAQAPAATPVVPRQTVPELQVGQRDERGNVIKYVYARDPDYVVYYSRPARRWWQRGNNCEGVQAQLSSDPATRKAQRSKLLPLGVDRAKLKALLADWPRRQSYDASIATALQLALDGDESANDPSPKAAQQTLIDARTSILGEREVALRAQYVTLTLGLGTLGFTLLAIAHVLIYLSGHLGGMNIWVGTEAGLVGAILSIATGLRRRTVALDIGIRGNLSDCVLRLIIGAVSGGTLILLFATGMVPALHTAQGDMDVASSIQFAILLGIVGGFIEQLVPSLLEKQGDRLSGTDAATASPADAAGKQAAPA